MMAKVAVFVAVMVTPFFVAPACWSDLITVSDATLALGVLDGQSGSVMTTVDGTGLGAAYPQFPATHSGVNSTGILSDGLSGAIISIHYDFGSMELLDYVRIWNYHGNLAGDAGINRGARDIRLFGSNVADAFGDESHASWEQIASLSLAQASPDGNVIPYGEEFDLEDGSWRYLRFIVDTNYGTPRTALAEVQFVSSGIPEPSTAYVLGLACLAGMATRRRKLHIAGIGRAADC